MNAKRVSRWLCLAAVLLLLSSAPARAQEQPKSSEQNEASPKHESIGGELAKEKREAPGEEEENENLKHSAVIQKLAKVTGLSVHQAHLAAIGLNFAIVVFLVYWFARKSVPAALRHRTESIQRALEEARAASRDAGQRLSEIEARLSKLDSEIAQMQTSAEKEAQAEEIRVRQAAEEDLKKVVQAAEQEIDAAVKQARRELMSQTADLAVALARKQIHVDPATDQSLVRDFTVKLASENGGKDRA
jgi:F-type H+-transporting ATPase subunit b